MKKYSVFAFFALSFFFFPSSYEQDNLSFTVNGVTFEMIFVEGGTFAMGCTSEDGVCYSGERPAHKVTLPDFYMGEFQVTQKLWQAVMGTSIQQQSLKGSGEIWALDAKLKELEKKTNRKSNRDSNTAFDLADVRRDGNVLSKDYDGFLNGVGDNYPIYFINYYECERFCHKLNQLLTDQLPEGYRFRMPTEAQWEYAARGGNKSQNYTFSGNNNIDDVVWYIANSDGTTSVAGKKIKNELCIYDMSGNVWEWCRDKYGENYYSRAPSINPEGPNKGAQYVLRGGSWNNDRWHCRTEARNNANPEARTKDYGFRLSLHLPTGLSGSGFFGYTGKFTSSQISSGKNLTFKANDVKFEMIFVEGGNFVMGCPSEKPHCYSNETPYRKVKLSNYYMGKFEVTQKLWNAVMGTTVRQLRDLVNIN
jgi:formylglycine-generating enzyme required for sulfatase activity